MFEFTFGSCYVSHLLKIIKHLTIFPLLLNDSLFHAQLITEIREIHARLIIVISDYVY